MGRFKSGISFLIVLTSILAGIGTAILHPYVHVLKMEEHPVQQSKSAQQALAHLDAADSCYVCTFSKKLTSGGITDITFELTLIPSTPQISPSFSFNNGYEFIIFLRAPPLV